MEQDVIIQGELVEFRGDSRCNTCRSGGHECILRKELERCLLCSSTDKGCIFTRVITLSGPKSVFDWDDLIKREHKSPIDPISKELVKAEDDTISAPPSRMTTMDTTQATVTRNTTFGMDEMEVDQTNKNRAEAEISRNKDALTPPEDRKFIDNAAEDEDMDQLSASVSVVEISDSEWHRDPNFRKRRVTHRSEEALPPELRGGLDPYARKGLNVAPITSLQEQMDQMKRRQKNAKVEDWVLVEQDLSSIDLPPERPPSEPDLTVETIDNVTDLAEPAFSTEDINLEIKDFNVASKFESISTQTASPWIDAVALRSLEGSKAQPASSTAAMTRFELYAKYIETFSRAETNGENAVDEDQDFKQVTLLFDRLSLSGIRIESLEPFRQKIKEHLQAFWNAAKGLKFSEQPGDVAENRPKSVIDNMEETAPSWQERFISRNSAPLGTVSQQVLDLESMAPVFLPQKSRKVTSDQKQQVAMLKKFGGACADCRRQKKKCHVSHIRILDDADWSGGEGIEFLQEPKARAYMSTSKINGIGAHIDRGDDIPTQYSNLGKELDTFREEAYPTAMVEDQDSPEGQNAAKAESLSCKHCGQRFTGTRKNRKSNLRRHMQKKHPDIRRHSRSLSNTPSLPTVRVQDDEETREEHEESSRPVQTHVQGPTRSNRIGVASLLVDPARLTPMRSPASPGKPEDQMEGLTAENHKPNMEPTPAASPLMTTSTTAGASTLSGMSIYPPGQITRFSPRPPAQKPDRDPKKEFKCDIPGCTRATKTFFSLNDLDRHKKSVHEMMPTTGDKRVFVCTGAACNKIDKIWPRLDNFKSHLSRKHPNQNISNLVRDSTVYQFHQPGSIPNTGRKSYICASEYCMGLMQSIVWPSIEGFETHLKRMHHDENADELIMKSKHLFDTRYRASLDQQKAKREEVTQGDTSVPAPVTAWN